MSQIVAIDLEEGNNSDFSGVSGAGFSTTAKLAGTNYGLLAAVDGQTDRFGYHTLGTPNTSGKLRARFYFDINTLSMGADTRFQIFQVSNSSSSSLIDVKIHKNTGYYLYCGIYDDGSGVDTADYLISDAEHYVEFYLTKSTGNNGTFELWIDGISKYSNSTLDNDTIFKDYNELLAGAFNIEAGITGNFFIDEIIVNDDGSLIGPLGGSVPIEGEACWGHDTGVVETNVRDFASNWTGTGAITGSGDSERLELETTEYMISEVVNTGVRHIELDYNHYAAGDTINLDYRHGADKAACEAASWNDYSGPFESLGYVQIRVTSTL